ncbi:MAG: integrin alpha, partial [Planctomycetota bacterium]
MNTFRFPISLAVLALTGAASAQTVGGGWDTLGQIDGEMDGDSLGTSMDLGPDIDGDGFPEIVAGLGWRYDAQSQLVGGVQLLSGRTGARLWSYIPVSGPVFGSQAGMVVSFVPDLNGDGVVDVISGSYLANDWEGKVIVLSGRDGSVIREHDGERSLFHGNGERWGAAVLGVPDMNGDGAGDYVVGGPSHEGPSGERIAGRVVCFSGLTGMMLWEKIGLNFSDGIGEILTIGPDLNGDGRLEILVSTSIDPPGFLRVGTALLLDGRNGNTLRSYQPSVISDDHLFSTSLATIEDMDGDSLVDFVVGAPGDFGKLGYVTLISSATGNEIWTYTGDDPYYLLGQKVFVVDDLNQDGVQDVIVYEPGNRTAGVESENPLHVISGLTGERLWFLGPDGGFGSLFYGVSILAFDRAGDSIPELFVGQAGSGPDPYTSLGRIQVRNYSPFLSTTSPSLSASAATPLRFELDFPNSEAGHTYRIMASAAGIGTTVLGGLAIPLVNDSYFQQTLVAPPQVFQGRLNASGDLSVQMNFSTASLTPLIGTTMQFAAIS